MSKPLFHLFFTALYAIGAIGCSGTALSPQKRALTNSAIRAETAYVEGYPYVAASHWEEVIRKSQNLDDRKNEALGHANLATVYLNSGKMELAETHLLKAQNLTDPQTEPERYMRNALHLTTALIHQNKKDQAQTALSDIYKLLGKNGNDILYATFQNAQGLLWMHQGLFKKACDAFEQAQKLGAANNNKSIEAASLNNLGYCYLEKSALAESKACFEEALEIDKSREYLPGIGLNLLGLALLADKESRREDALVLHDRAFRVNKGLGAEHLVSISQKALKRLSKNSN
ncbi:MAG: hypothetical protein QGI45_03955 [Myxococcota bacterium]|jgi:tetratricopeptide (TPR) repeat protein|nr:hypothetical protein [Myxococcota bacterium]